MRSINYCDKCGNCSRCGNCCAAMIPLTREEEETIRKYIQENKIEPEYFQDEKNMNLQCCFYDRTNKKCKIILQKCLIFYKSYILQNIKSSLQKSL